MRRCLLLAVCVMVCLAGWAQQARKAYCELTVWSGQSSMLNVVVTIDLGMQNYPTASIYGADGKPVTFISNMDAVNYMAKRGWTVVSTYYKTHSQLESAHYVMEKSVTNESQVTKGLTLKPINIKTGFPGTKP